ncbi:MAG TPA: hypothetical protein VGC47_00920 [Acidimicrobiia bacterium]
MTDGPTSADVRFAVLPGTRHVYEKRPVDAYLQEVARAMERLEERATLAEDRVADLERSLVAANAQLGTLVGRPGRQASAVPPPIADHGVVGPAAVKLDQLERAAKRKLAEAAARLDAAEREARSLLDTARVEAAAIVPGGRGGGVDETPSAELERLRVIVAALRRLSDVRREQSLERLTAIAERLEGAGVAGGAELDELFALLGATRSGEPLVVDLAAEDSPAGRLD